MEKFKQGAKIGVVWAIIGGLLWGALDVDVIVVSSKHDLGGLPFLSWVSVAWVLFLSVVLMLCWWGLWLWLGGWTMVRDRREGGGLDDKKWMVIWGGWTLLSVVLGFMGSRSFSLVAWLKVLGVSVAVGGGGALLMWVVLDWMERVGKDWRIWWRGVSWLIGIFLLSLISVIVFQGVRVLSKGRVGQAMSGKGGEGKNLILITVEAWRADAFNESLMPALKGWSEQAVEFKRAYSPAPWTLPSFASMMSGFYPGQLGVSTTDYSVDEIKYGGRLIEGVETLAERLEMEGYLTQGFLTNEWLSEERGFGQGMDGLVQLEVQRPYHYVFHGKDMTVTGWWRRLGLEGAVEGGWNLLVGEASLHKWGTDAELVLKLGRNWLLREPDEPFFLWMHLMDPHAPYQPGRDYWPEVEGIEEERIEKLQEVRPLDVYRIRWRENDKQAYEGLYRGEVGYTDDSLVSRFLQRVEEWGYLENTVVVITADHGEEFWDHGGLGHATSMYEEQVRVPLVVRGPGIKDGEVNKLVSLVDLKPSMLDILEIEESERSWWSEDYGERVWLEGNGRGDYLKAVVEGDWKLIWNTFTDKYELYNLRTDEDEQDNVADRDPGVVEKLQNLLKDRVEENENFYQRLEKGEMKGSLGDVVGY